jgi:hypothetical protein
MRGWLLMLAPFCAAWQGAGEGTVEWAAGRDKVAGEHAVVHAEAVARQEAGQGLSLVVTLELGEGDGLLTIRAVQPVAEGQEVTLPDDRVQVAYTEYTADGSVRFSAARVTDGRLMVLPGAGALTFRISLDLDDGADGPHGWRRLRDGDLTALPADGPETDDDDGPPPPPGPDPVANVGGCEGGSYDDTSDTSDTGASSGDSGCEGDDTDSGSSDSGCAGDDTSSGSSGSGCAGDDTGSSSGGGCAGDGGDGCAVAAPGHLPRLHRRTVARLVDWMPWLMALSALRLMRRRPGRPVRRAA